MSSADARLEAPAPVTDAVQYDFAPITDAVQYITWGMHGNLYMERQFCVGPMLIFDEGIPDLIENQRFFRRVHLPSGETPLRKRSEMVRYFWENNGEGEMQLIAYYPATEMAKETAPPATICPGAPPRRRASSRLCSIAASAKIAADAAVKIPSTPTSRPYRKGFATPKRPAPSMADSLIRAPRRLRCQ
ncbi:unnamed protein product, partial [Mesorhabditis spiculigera]